MERGVRASLSGLFPLGGKQWATNWAALPRGTGSGEKRKEETQDTKKTKNKKTWKELCLL
jgi:hypothetical protein